MIPIIFISLCFAWFFYQHFENKRKARLEEQQEKRRESYAHLLDILKRKEETEEINNTNSTE